MTERKGKSKGTFTSAPLVALTVRALRNLDASLLPPLAREPDYFAEAAANTHSKTDILEYAYERGGALPLLGIGSILNEMAELPSMRVLMNSVDTNVLASKWMRLEVFYHSAHRVKIDSLAPGTWNCTRHWKDDKPPTDAENFLICGLMTGLLGLFGCRDVTASIGGQRYQAGMIATAPIYPTQSTLSWQFHWSGVGQNSAAAYALARNDSLSDKPYLSPSLSDQLIELFGQDLGRVWKLGEAARTLVRTTRSLQRDIQNTGHTFTSLVRKARSQEACRLLSETSMSLADIGYSCGYSDQAHFQRDFRRAVNMTPLQFRQVDQSDS